MSGATGRRALPGPIVDLIRDGIPDGTYNARGNRGVWQALVRVAMSAVQRGHTETDLAAYITARGSRLGTQLVVDPDNGRDRQAREVRADVARAWAKALEITASRPAQARADADRRIAAATALVEDADAPLDDAQRAVLSHAVRQADAYSTPTPVLPRNGLLAATGLGLTALRTALRRLDAAGLLVVVEPGRRYGKDGGPTGGRARATRYRLASPEEAATALATSPTPRAGYVVPPADVVPPRHGLTGAPTDVVPPSPLNPDGADVTLDGLAQEKLDAARRAVEELGHAVLAQALREATGGTGDSQRGDNVIPLRRAAGGR